jgi:hypothetical protein
VLGGGAHAATTTLRLAKWDSLPTGHITPAGFNSQLGGTNKGTRVYDDSYVAADSRGGGKVYRLKLAAGTYKNYPSGNNGIVTFIPLSRKVDNACLSYDIRFSPNFDWSLGGKLPGLEGVAPGVSPSKPTGGGKPGGLGWSGRLMWLGPKAYAWAGPTDMVVSYMYGPRQQSYYGDNVEWHKAFVRGWQTVKMCYQMNTVGSANGKLQGWVNGTRVLNRTNYVFRTRKDVHITHLNWSIFRGGNTRAWVGKTDGYIDFDNVRITTG